LTGRRQNEEEKIHSGTEQLCNTKYQNKEEKITVGGGKIGKRKLLTWKSKAPKIGKREPL